MVLAHRKFDLSKRNRT